MTTKKHYKRHSSHKTKAEAEAEARRLRNQGQKVRVRRDPLTGHFIVELLFLGLALGVVGALLR